MSRWREVEVPASRGGQPRSVVVRAAVVVGLAGCLAAVGRPIAGAGLLVAAVLLLSLSALCPSIAARVEALALRFGHAVGRAVGIVLLSGIALVVIWPVSLVGRVLRRDPLMATTGWAARSDAPRQKGRAFGWEPAPPASSAATRSVGIALRAVGLVLAAAMLNYAVGWTWEEFFGDHDMPTSSAGGGLDELRVAPAADVGWADAYWREFESLEIGFEPYLLSRLAPAEGSYINVRGAVRRSYQPRPPADAAPVVWLLGGSALWGVGQRDMHTIPSELARIAELRGSPVRVVNLGQPGYTSWQSVLLLEQQLAVSPAPDLIVLYDGAADLEVQLERPSDAPTHFNVPGVNTDLVGRDSAREQLEEWWATYREVSIVNRAIERVQAVFGAQRAEASEPDVIANVVDLHQRSTDLAAFVAGRHGVPVVFAWQAAEGVPGDDGGYRTVASVPTDPSVADLSGVLDDIEDPVYLDGVLTNERGARVVAAELWARVQPFVAE